MGALAVVEPQDYVSQSLSRYGLQSPTGLIRMMVQQSNCFIVVERGVGMQNMMQERAPRRGRRAAPELEHGRRPDGHRRLRAHARRGVLGERRRAASAARVGGLLGRPRRGSARSPAVSSSRKRRPACSSPTRGRGVQVAAAEGSSRKADLSVGAGFLGGSAGAAGGGYTNTNEGKVIAASLIDNYNQVVVRCGTTRLCSAASAP